MDREQDPLEPEVRCPVRWDRVEDVKAVDGVTVGRVSINVSLAILR